MSRAARRRKRPLPRRGNSVPVFHGAGFCVTREFPACRDVARRGQDTRPTNLRNLQTKTANRKFPSGRGILRDPQLPHLPERPHPKEPWDFAWPANFPPAGTLSGAVKTRALQIHGICEQKQQIANSRPVVGRGLDPAVGFCVTRKFPACRDVARRGQDARPTNLRNLQTKTANRKFPSGRGILRGPQISCLPGRCPARSRRAPYKSTEFANENGKPQIPVRAARAILSWREQAVAASTHPCSVGRGLDPAARFWAARKFPACRDVARRGQDARPTNLRNLQTKMANRKFPSGRRGGL